MRYKEKERKINYQSPINKVVLALGNRGFSVNCITEIVNEHLKGCDMSECQVYYRLRKSDILLKDYRKGASDLAKAEINKVRIRLFKRSKTA